MITNHDTIITPTNRTDAFIFFVVYYLDLFLLRRRRLFRFRRFASVATAVAVAAAAAADDDDDCCYQVSLIVNLVSHVWRGEKERESKKEWGEKFAYQSHYDWAIFDNVQKKEYTAPEKQKPKANGF